MTRHAAAFLLLAAALTGCGRGRPHSETSVFQRVPMRTGGATLPFSAAVRAGSLLYVSGQLGTDSTLRLVSGGIGPETRQALENIRSIVEAAGGSMERIVKCTVMLADIDDWGAMNQEYVKFFSAGLPARSALGANGLAMGARVEIECIAALEDR
jgi:2-iminobutanoate/2-iminopropanoate deaminase